MVAAYDVIVVGLGAAGAAAAIEAARSGARVLVLEAAGGPGGTSSLSGGEIYLGGGTALQRACGVSDDPEAMFGFLVRALGPGCDEAKLRCYCEQSAEHFDWLAGCGVPFHPTTFDRPVWTPPDASGLMWMGEAAWPYAEYAAPAPRGHRPAVPGPGGRVLVDALVATADALGVEVRLDTRVVGLRTDAGRVVGLTARSFGGEQDLDLRGGVVLATGGFADADDLVSRYVPQLLPHDRLSDGGDDGSGIRLGMEAGAATRNLGSHQLALSLVPGLAARGIVVDGTGQRFLNEDVYPGLLSQAAATRPAPIWVVVDEQAFTDIDPGDLRQVGPQYVADTAAELGAELGLPPGALEETVERYNAAAREGADPVHHKAARWVRPLVGPLAAVDPRRGLDQRRTTRPTGTGFAGFTLGGLVTDLDGRVLDPAGEPLAGLFAAGRVTAGIHGSGYVSGTSLGDATLFGRRAGRAAARGA